MKKIIAAPLLFILAFAGGLQAQEHTANKLHLRMDLLLGGGYDTNLFRENGPLPDDFDYPEYQPSEKRKSKALDAKGDVSIGYYFPRLPFWQMSKITLGTRGVYSRSAGKKSAENRVMEDFYQWGLDGDWFIKLTGAQASDGLFVLVSDSYTRTRYTNAKSFVEQNDPGKRLDAYNYSENLFKASIGYMLMGIPFGFEYKAPSRWSPEKTAVSKENFDYDPGPRSYKFFMGILMGGVRTMTTPSPSELKADRHSNLVNLDGFVLIASGEGWSRQYKNYKARNLSNTITAQSPLLVENRQNFKVDLHIGSMMIAPVLNITQKNGIFVHYEYYTNKDNYVKYYDYVWNRGWAGLAYTMSIVELSGRYEYHKKDFKERIALGTEKRRDKFQVGRGNIDLHFTSEFTASVQYAYTKARSNEQAVYLDYDKHYVYAGVEYFLDKKF